jgi:hypothetical protein
MLSIIQHCDLYMKLIFPTSPDFLNCEMLHQSYVTVDILEQFLLYE